MATQKFSPTQHKIISEGSTEELRKEVQHRLVDMNLTAPGTCGKLAAALSILLNKKVSRNSLNMALSGYRQTAPYLDYLQKLNKHLQYCQQNQIDPVLSNTGLENNQVKNMELANGT